jgi:hypothetical protein
MELGSFDAGLEAVGRCLLGRDGFWPAFIYYLFGQFEGLGQRTRIRVGTSSVAFTLPDSSCKLSAILDFESLKFGEGLGYY